MRNHPGNIFAVFDGCFLLGIAANHLPRGSDIPGHGYLIAFDAFLTVLRVSSVIILLNFIFDISTEQRGGEQQTFIQNLPFGANLAGVGFCGLKSVRLALLPLPDCARAKLLPPGGCWETA